MGLRGTDMAKEAADLILEDDRFPTIGAAVEEGRIIFDNIREFVFYLFSCNLAEILVFLGAGLGGQTAPLLPLQILWLNLVTDTPDVGTTPIGLSRQRATVTVLGEVGAASWRRCWWRGSLRWLISWGSLAGDTYTAPPLDAPF
jgi:magnesium-transporting ATPase (P-type)